MKIKIAIPIITNPTAKILLNKRTNPARRTIPDIR